MANSPDGIEYEENFFTALRQLVENTPGVIAPTEFQLGAIAVVVENTPHAYWVWSVLSEYEDRSSDTWPSTTRVTYATENNDWYPILDEDYKRGIYRSPEFCAQIAFAAICEHARQGFPKIEISQALDPDRMQALLAAKTRQPFDVTL